MTVRSLLMNLRSHFVDAARKEQCMKQSFCVRSCGLILILALATGGKIFAQTSVLFPDQGTTLNGKAVYVSAFLRPGDEVRTGKARAKVDFGGTELEMAPHSVLTVGSRMIVRCGEATVLYGTITFDTGSTTTALGVGQATHADTGECADSLPDAPSAASVDQTSTRASSWWARNPRQGAPVAGSGFRFDGPPPSDARFWAANGAMFSSSVVNVELASRCLAEKTCSAIPGPFQSRAAMYGVGLPAEFAVSYLSYSLKRKGYRWWMVPMTAVTGANAFVAYHWANRLR